MRRVALGTVLAMALMGVAAPAMAAESVPDHQAVQINPAPVEPSPSHHKIKAPPAGTHGDLWQLAHGGFKDGADGTAVADEVAAATPQPSVHSVPVLIKAGVVVAKVAKAKAIKQPKKQTPNQAKAAKQQQAKAAKQPKQAAAKPAKQPKTTKTTKVKNPPPAIPTANQTSQQASQTAFQQAFANPPRVRPRKHP